MPKPKIDIVKLNQMLRAGKSVKQCAEYFGVTPPAISMAKKNLSVAVVKNVALESAHKVVDKNLNAIDQLWKINEVANGLLNELTGEDRVINRMTSAIEEILSPEGDPKQIKRLVRQISQDKETAIKACAEIRGQLKLQLEIFQALYDMKAVAEFQEEVLSAIGEVSPEVKNAIIGKLNQRRAIRQSISIN